MIDHRIEAFLSKHSGVMLRGEDQSARDALAELSIAPDSELASFYMRYQGPFISPRRFRELLDIEYPTAEVVEQTDYVRGEYGVPDDFVCLTTIEGEGMYLYQVSTGAVFDVGIEDVSRLGGDGDVEPRWPSFNAFLLEFFGLR